MRVAKWIGVALAGVLLAAVAVVLIVTLAVDPNRFKGRIEQLMSEASGQPFAIQGNLDIAWFPWLALRMGEARLGEAPLVQWRSASFGARLIPLIRGRLVMSRVRFDGLRVRLERGADGRGNWESLLAVNRGSGASGASPQIAGLQIRDGTLEFVDGRSGTRVALGDWRLDLGEWRREEPFSLSTEFALQRGGASSPAVDVALEVPRVEWKQSPLRVSVPRMRLRVANASLEGDAALRGTEPLRAEGALTLKIDSLRDWLGHLAVGGPRPQDPRALGALSLASRWTVVDGAIALQPIHLQLDDTRFEGEARRPAGEEAILRFELHGDRIALDRYVRIENMSSEPFELPTAALRALRVAGVLSFGEVRIGDATIRNARIRLETPQ